MNAPYAPWPDVRRGISALSDASWQINKALLGRLGANGAVFPSLDRLTRSNRYGLAALWPALDDEGQYDATRFKATLFRIKEQLFDLAGNDWEKQVVDDGRAVLAKAADSRRILVGWISVIESLTQTAQIEWAGRSGADKKLWVKSIVRRLYRKEKLKLPMVPVWAEPVVIDVVVDIGIDLAVAINNRDHGWLKEDGRRASLFRHLWWSLPLLLAPLKRLLRALVRPVLALGVRLYMAWTDLRLHVTPMPPGMEQAIKEIDTSGVRRDIDALNDFVVELTCWLRNNRERFIAFANLVAIAAQEAEWYGGLDGPGKKAYARDLLLEVLAEAGVTTGTGLGASLLRFGIDQLIEAVVLLMNKRGTLKSAGASAGSAR